MEQLEREVAVFAPSGDIPICIDPMRMQQAFVNLVAYALRYTPTRGKIWVTGTIEGSEVVVRVADEGTGIDPEKLGGLFEAFTRVGIKGSRLGLGIGLSLAKRDFGAAWRICPSKKRGRGKGSRFVARFRAEPSAAPQ